MSEINYFNIFYYAKWCGPVAFERYKLVDDVAVDIDSLHIKKIILNNWYWVIIIDTVVYCSAAIRLQRTPADNLIGLLLLSIWLLLQRHMALRLCFMNI
jgi:hypothetical protein